MTMDAAPTEPRPESAFDQAYNDIKTAEAAKPNPEEIIRLHPIRQGENPEYDILLSHGVTEEEINSGLIARQKLLDAGFVFHNKIGGGEKPLLNAEINGVDYGKRTLLTQDELDTVIAFQAKYPGTFGLQGHSLEDVRKDMLLFLHTATDPRQIGMKHRSSVFYKATEGRRDARKQFTGSPDDWRVVDAYLKDWYALIEATFESLSPSEKLAFDNNFNLFKSEKEKGFMEAHCSDIYPWPEPDPNANFLAPHTSRGFRVGKSEVRRGKLQGSPSPFLDSGFHFEENQDLTLFFPDKSARRLNTAVFHLASRGLSEMGRSNNGSFDQQYFTLGEYVENLYPKTLAEKEALYKKELPIFLANKEADPEKIFKGIQEVLIKKARTWSTSEVASEEVKSVLEQEERDKIFMAEHGLK
jgi:hypothetical protein